MNTELNGWYFPFRYKLTLLITFIILTLLVATFLVVQGHIKENALENIKNDLKRTRAMVARLMEDRWIRLWEMAMGVGGNELIRVVLTDKTLDQMTRSDILENEILPDYSQLSLLSVADADGEILAINKASQDLRHLLPKEDFFKAGLEGKPTSGFIIYQNRCAQIMVLPLTIGPSEEQEVIGVLMVGLTWSEADLKRIKALSRADLAFFQEKEFYLATQLQTVNDRLISVQALNVFLNDVSWDESLVEPAIVYIKDERFLYLKVISKTGFSPPHILIRSLDRQLAFVKKIRQIMAQFGLTGIFIGFLVSFFFALGISRPIKVLQAATSEVELGNFHHRVGIWSRDEFSRLGHSFNQMIAGLAEKERIRGAMNKVVCEEIADEILKGDLQLGGEEKTATILFSDIRGFTSLSEGLGPKQLLDLLNNYFTRVSACIDQHHGNIDKYLGDAVMALFGVPISHNYDAKNAVLAALDVIEALKEFNRTFEKVGGKTIDIGIGINTGSLVAGLMGASSRMEYTVLGDVVNLASRLEGLTKRYGVHIIISESSYLAVQESKVHHEPIIKFRELDTVQVKGKTTGIKIYQVFDRDQLTDGLDTLVSRFQEARQLLKTMHFHESLEAFKALEVDWPSDGATKIFRARASAYLKEPDVYEKECQGGVYICTDK